MTTRPEQIDEVGLSDAIDEIDLTILGRRDRIRRAIAGKIKLTHEAIERDKSRLKALEVAAASLRILSRHADVVREAERKARGAE